LLLWPLLFVQQLLTGDLRSATWIQVINLSLGHVSVESWRDDPMVVDAFVEDYAEFEPLAIAAGQQARSLIEPGYFDAKSVPDQSILLQEVLMNAAETSRLFQVTQTLAQCRARLPAPAAWRTSTGSSPEVACTRRSAAICSSLRPVSSRSSWC
jgi:hypothetical protein